MAELDTRPGAEHPAAARTALAAVLLVSDHGWWATHLGGALTGEGFQVTWDRTGDSVRGGEALARIDIAIVDLRMRAQSGLAVCSSLRARSALPLLVMGAPDEEMLVLAAYAAGADQFVAADISARLVMARVRALLRRAPPRPSATAAEPDRDVPVTIDETSGTALVSGAVVKLSRREMEVLRVLVARSGCVVSRTELARSAPTLSADRRLDFVIRRLRQKLEAVDGRRRINAVRGGRFPAGARPGGACRVSAGATVADVTEDVAFGSTAVHFRFNDRPGPPLSVTAVMNGDLSPRPLQATDAAGAAAIDALVAQRRADLARLTLGVRTARQRCERVEAAFASEPPVASVGAPTDLLSAVDTMLRAAMAAAESDIAVACEQARAAVAPRRR